MASYDNSLPEPEDDIVELERILASSNSPTEPADYIIWKNNEGYTNALNQETGRIEQREHDSRLVIQSTIDSLSMNKVGGLIYLTPGIYEIDVSQAPLILKSNIIVTGAGIDSTVLKGIGKATYFTPIIRNEHLGTISRIDKDKNIELSDMTITTDGDRDSITSNGIQLPNSQYSNLVLGQFDDIVLERLKVTNGYWMCFTIMGENNPAPEERSTRLVMRDIIAENCGHADKTDDAVETIAFHAVDDVMISNFTIIDSGAAFISMNKISNNTGETYETSSSRNIVIDGFNFDGMIDRSSMGIRISDKSENIKILNGRIANTKGNGIGVTFPGSSQIVISNITLENISPELTLSSGTLGNDRSMDYSGVRMRWASDVDVSNVTVSNDKHRIADGVINGIDVANSEQINLTEISIIDFSSTGILIANSHGVLLHNVTTIHGSSQGGYAIEITESDKVSLKNIAMKSNNSFYPNTSQLKLEDVAIQLLENVTQIKS